MSGLYFQIGADFDKLKQLKREIDDLKSTLLGMDKSADPQTFEALNKRLQQLQSEFNKSAESAARFGATYENNLRNKIQESSVTVNELTRKIIEQKSIIKDIEHDVNKLGQAYRKLSNSDTGKKDALNEWNAAKKALAEEKSSLFALQQRQSEARLTTRELREEYSRYTGNIRDSSKATDNASDSLLNYIKKGAALAGVTFGIDKIKDLGSEIISVRNQFQQLEIAFGTMLKSKDKAASLMKDLTQFAAETPFGLQSAASGAKQLLAYGSTADTVIRELTMLGDVAAGTGQQIGDLVYLYGTLRTQGRAYLMDIRQFAGRGIPIYDELAKVLNTSKDKVNDFVSAGKVGFKEVEQAFKNMTSQGGLYGGLMEQQSASIGGRIEALKDNIDSIFNTIGKDSEGIIYKSIDGLNSLVENYEKIGKVLLSLVATYGAYKTAVILTTAIEKIRTTQAVYDIATKEIQLGLTIKNIWAQSALNKVISANPYAIAAVLAIGLVTTMWALRDSTSAAEKAQEDYNKRKEEAIQKEQDHKSKIEELINTATNQALADLQRVDALETLKQKYPQIFKEYDIELLKLADILSIKKQIAEQDGKDAVKNRRNQYEEALNRQKQAEERYNKLVKEYGGSINYQGIINDAKSRLTKANEELKLYEKDVQTDRINTFIAGIEKMSKKQIEVELQARQQLEHNLKQSGRSRGVISGGLLDGTFSKDQLNQQTAALETELNKRNQARFNYVDLEKKYNSELKALQNERIKIEKDDLKLTPEELKKKIDDIDAKIKAKEEDLKSLTGKTSKQADAAANKTETAAEKARKAAQKTVDDQLKLNNDKAKALLDARNVQLENDQKLLDLQEEGFDKQQKQIDLNHQKELLSIKKRTQELIEKRQDEERKQWDLNNPNGSKTPFTPKTLSIADLSASDQADLANSTIIASKVQEKDTADLLKSLLAKYQDYNTQRAEVNKQFDAEEKALTQSRNAENADQIDAALAVIVKKRKEALKSIGESEANETKKSSDLFIRLFTDSSQQSIEQIRKVIVETQALYNYLSTTKEEDITSNFGFTADQLKAFKGNAEELKAVLDGLISKKKDLAGRSEFDSLILGVKDGIAKIQKGGTKNIGQGITDIGAAATAMMPTIEKFGQDLGAIFGSDMADDISVITDLLGATVEVGTGVGKIMSGDIVGGIKDTVSGIAKVFSMASAANERHREALKLIAAAAKAQEHAYQIALRMQSLAYEQGNTIFGDDPYGKAINGAIEYKNALIELDKSLKGDGKLNRKSIFEIPKKSDIAALENLQIVTGHKKTGLFGLGKGKDTYSGILEIYPELIDQNGEFNLELAKTVIAERKMSDENKIAFQTMIDNAEQAKEAYAVMKDYLTNIFGDLGDTMTDALVNSFLKGEDAAKAFYESASSMVQNLVKDIINAAVIAPIIKKATEESMAIMEDTSLTDEQRMEKLMLVVDDILNKGLEAQDQAKGLYDYSNEKWKEITGKELFTDTSQSASSGYSVSMSQDTGDAIEGRVTGIQISALNTEANTLVISNDVKGILTQTISIGDSLRKSVVMVDEIKTIQLNSYYELKNISKNSDSIPLIHQRLGEVSTKLDRL